MLVWHDRSLLGVIRLLFIFQVPQILWFLFQHFSMNWRKVNCLVIPLFPHNDGKYADLFLALWFIHILLWHSILDILLTRIDQTFNLTVTFRDSLPFLSPSSLTFVFCVDLACWKSEWFNDCFLQSILFILVFSHFSFIRVIGYVVSWLHLHRSSSLPCSYVEANEEDPLF